MIGVTVRDLARALGKSRWEVQQMVRDGEIAPPANARRRRTRSHRSPRHNTLLSARAVLGRWPTLGRVIRWRFGTPESTTNQGGA